MSDARAITETADTPPSGAVTVDYTLLPGDWVAFSAFVARRSSLTRRANWIRSGVMLLLGPLAVVVGFVIARGLYAVTDGSALPALALGCAIGLAVFAGIIWIAIPAIQRLSWHGMARSRKRAAYFRPIRLSLSPEGISGASGVGIGVTRWPAVLTVETCAAGVCMLIAPGHGHMVPRHAFADPAGFDAFVRTAKDLHRQFGRFRAGAVDPG